MEPLKGETDDTMSGEGELMAEKAGLNCMSRSWIFFLNNIFSRAVDQVYHCICLEL